MIPKISNLVEMVQRRRADSSNSCAYIFVDSNGDEIARITYGEIDDAARAAAATLVRLGARGQRVLILCPQEPVFIAAFFGCLYAGAIAVPLWVPKSPADVDKLEIIARDASPLAAMTSTAVLPGLRARLASSVVLASLPCIGLDAPSRPIETPFLEKEVDPNEICYLQYTSGSTNSPKGVMISHANVITNFEAINEDFHHDPNSISVNWLPYFHDMGLVYGMLQPLYNKFCSIQMSPAVFAQRPLRWLEAISKYKATHSGGPNFAYELCIQKNTDQDLGLNLSTWRIAFNGAEPVRHETIRSFAQKFAHCGFKLSSFYPAYGLAEATLKVSGCQYQLLSDPSSRVNAKSQAVSCGFPATGTTVRIVDPESKTESSEGMVGEIWVSGAGIARGYWNRPAETSAVFHATLKNSPDGRGYLRTGDLGFVSNNELFVAGRLKDLIIIRGQNYHPEDLEISIRLGLGRSKLGNTVVFSAEIGGEERLIVMQEVHRRAERKHEDICSVIRKALSECHGVSPYCIALVREKTLPKTTSGKIQRHACRERFFRGDVQILSSHVEGDQKAVSATDWRASLAHVHQGRRAEIMLSYLEETVSSLLKISPGLFQPANSLASLGIDSLRASELKARVEAELEIDLSISDLLDSASCQDLAQTMAQHFLENTSTVLSAPSNPVLPPEYALSKGQESLLYLQRLSPAVPMFNIARAFRIKGTINADRIKKVFEDLVQRHSILRSVFNERHGNLVRTIRSNGIIDFAVISATQWTGDLLAQWLNEETNRIFDLGNDPLLRIRVATIQSDENVLLMVSHHLVMDLWSWTLLIREFTQAYEIGSAAGLPPLSAEYPSFVEWEDTALKGKKGEELRKYWSQRIPHDFERLGFPWDHKRPANERMQGANANFSLNSELTVAVRAFCRRHSISLYMMLVAALKVLLYRYTGQEQIIVGSPMANRARAEFRNIIGHFVNPVVLLTTFRDTVCFIDCLHQVRSTVIGALDHQHYPYQMLVKDLHPYRESARSPVFQTAFTFQTVPSEADNTLAVLSLNQAGRRGHLGPFEVDSLEIRKFFVQFDLSFNIAEGEENLIGNVEINLDVLEPLSGERIARQYCRLLERIVTDPQRRVCDLEILEEGETQQLLVDWNRTELKYPEKTVVELFEEQAEKTPEAVAVACGEEELSYGELNRRANQLGHYLRGKGVGAEVRVGLCVERSVEMVVGLLGILKAGGAYVPLDPKYPAERLSYMLNDSQARVLLTEKGQVGKLGEYEGEVVRVDEQQGEIGRHSHKNVEEKAVFANLAYVIYTSGSSGRPKGVQISHQAVVNLLSSMRREPGIVAEDVLLAVTTLSFDIAGLEIYLPLISGAKVRILSREAAGDGKKLEEALQQGITIMQATPVSWQMLVEAGWKGNKGLKALCGGEALSRKLAKKVAERSEELWNVYGPTETTIWSVMKKIEVGEGEEGEVWIGRPIGNTQVYVVDKELQPVPVGVLGEIYIGGDGLGRGYWNQAGLTAERFLPNPFRTGERLYRTGDIGRWRCDGNLEYAGRCDNQVKIRGFRIELGEIEAALKRQAGVRDCVVEVREKVAEDKRLVAYVVGTEAGAGEGLVAGLRQQLRRSLPEYMLPSEFIFLEELPLTPNGKINRRGLPMPAKLRGELASYIGPQTPIEQLVAQIWAELLGIEQVSIRDNFFALGGHSLLAMKLVSKFSEVYQVSIGLSEMFRGINTVQEMASRIEELLIEQADSGDRKAVFAEIDNLSENELERMLAEEQAKASSEEQGVSHASSIKL